MHITKNSLADKSTNALFQGITRVHSGAVSGITLTETALYSTEENRKQEEIPRYLNQTSLVRYMVNMSHYANFRNFNNYDSITGVFFA